MWITTLDSSVTIVGKVGTDKRSQTKKRKMKNWNKVRNVKFVEVYFTVYIVLCLILKVIITVIKEGKRSHPIWFTLYTNYVLIQTKNAKMLPKGKQPNNGKLKLIRYVGMPFLN